jgi:hypothetical protein
MPFYEKALSLGMAAVLALLTQVSFYDCGDKLRAKIVAVKDERRKSKIGTVIMPGVGIQCTRDSWQGDHASNVSANFL